MKKLIILIILLFSFQLVLAADTPQISIKTAFTDPYPVEPGKNLALSIEITNNGTRTAENVLIELKPVQPFTLLEASEKEIEEIHPSNTRVIEYDLFVDSSAVSALYEIPVSVYYNNYFNITKKIQVRIQGVPNFKILGIDGGELSPGNTEEMIVIIQNLGTGKAKRTTATFHSSSDMIKPVLSGGIVYLGEVDTNDEKDLSFVILASSDAEYGVYSGVVNVSYEDESGQRLSDTFDIGILVSGVPRLQIIKTEIDVEDRELTVEITNQGSAEAKAIKAELVVNDEIFDIDYVTRIKIDKRVTLKYAIPEKKTKADLKLYYSGPDNKEYSQVEPIVWKPTPFSFPKWLIGIIVLVIGYFVWKRSILKTLLGLRKSK